MDSMQGDVMVDDWQLPPGRRASLHRSRGARPQIGLHLASFPGAGLGETVGLSVGSNVGLAVGMFEGTCVGSAVGSNVGEIVGSNVGSSVGGGVGLKFVVVVLVVAVVAVVVVVVVVEVPYVGAFVGGGMVPLVVEGHRYSYCTDVILTVRSTSCDVEQHSFWISTWKSLAEAPPGTEDLHTGAKSKRPEPVWFGPLNTRQLPL